jgi:hypothetical protein
LSVSWMVVTDSEGRLVCPKLIFANFDIFKEQFHINGHYR